MRLAFIFGFALVTVGAIGLGLRYRKQHSIWTSEPKMYLGIQLGKPLSASVPNCADNDKRLCFDGTFISNEPDPLGGTMPFVDQGVVTQVVTNYRAEAEDLIREDLKTRFGEPQDSVNGTDSWSGKVLTVTMTKPGKDGIGYLTAALANMPSSKYAPHKNPF